MSDNNTDQPTLCKCGHPLYVTNTFPRWVYCDNPPCDYVVIIGQRFVDKMTKTYSESPFAKDGPFKGHLHGDPLLVKIIDVKPNYIDSNDTKEVSTT